VTFRIGVSRDLRADDGTLRIGSLDELDGMPGMEWFFLAEDGPEIGPEQLAECDALMLFAPRVSAASLRDAARLRVIARIGVGYDSVDVEECTRRRIFVTNTPDGVRRPMASAAMALMLGLAHRIVTKDSLVREGGWDRRFEHVGDGLKGKTLGLLGFGGIARELSRLARPFEMRQIASTPRLRSSETEPLGVEAVSLVTLLHESDYLVIAAPLTPETKGLLDATRLAQMKPSASLINIARGQIVDEGALEDALRAGRLAGAALDVFAREPIDPSSPLLARDNVILSPHAAGHTSELFDGCFASALRSVLDVVAGSPPTYLVNQEIMPARRPS
jgi:phosphoglycerate dehydrogenase-like enzyme